MPVQEHEEVLKAFRPLVEATARRFSGNGAMYEDLVQEGYLAMLELLPRCKNRKYLAKYLKDRLPARVRTAARRAWKVFKNEDEFDTEQFHGACCQELPWTRWVAEGALPERDCRIVRLLEVGYTQQEIAQKIGLTQQAVSFRVGQIREKMQEREM